MYIENSITKNYISPYINIYIYIYITARTLILRERATKADADTVTCADGQQPSLFRRRVRLPPRLIFFLILVEPDSIISSDL